MHFVNKNFIMKKDKLASLFYQFKDSEVDQKNMMTITGRGTCDWDSSGCAEETAAAPGTCQDTGSSPNSDDDPEECDYCMDMQ